MDEEIKQLLKDLHNTLFDFNPNSKGFRIPCDCPPGEPVYKDFKIVDVKPTFSCPYCRLARVVDKIYEEESRDEARKQAWR